MKARTGLCAVALGSLWSFAAVGGAVAGTVYQGSDYSYTTSSNRKAVVCDREADARTAYVKGEYGSGTNYRINDQDGSSGSCWQNASDIPSGIEWHQTCEDINNAPDACGNRDDHF